MIKRVMIFGRTGSGKSTFALRLAKALNLPLHHLDRWFYTENWQERDAAEFLRLQQGFVNQDEWIVDGNCLKSLEMRYGRADVAIFFSLPVGICFFRLLKRRFFKNKAIQDRAPRCPEKITFKLLRYTWGFEDRVRDRVKELRARYPHVLFYSVKSDQEAAALFDQLTGQARGDCP